MQPSQIGNWLAHPESMGAEAIQLLPDLIEQHPYCAAYRLLYTIALANTHSTRLNDELRRTAIMLPDSQRLFELVNNGEYEWVQLMFDMQRKQKQQVDSVDGFVLIDQYLESTEGNLLANELLERNFDISEMIDEEPAASDETDDTLSAIDSFLEAEQAGQLFVPTAQQKDAEMPDSEPEKIREKAFLTESLAKLYVKQHKYEQALAIFSSLNLQYSKKNSYFADQIRYLEKVIEYQRH